MIRKLIFRCFIACFALFLFVVTAICFCFWLVNQDPSFYAQLRDQTFTDAERNAAEDRLSLQTVGIESWAKAWARQAALAKNDGSNKPSPSNRPTQTLTISQSDLNATLSSDHYSSGDLRNLRAQINDDQISLGAELRIFEESPVVVSVDFKIRVLCDKLKIEMINGRLGRLPVPLQWILNSVPESALSPTNKCEFHFTEATPYILLNITDQSHANPVLKQVTTVNGEIILDINPPVVAF